MGSPALTPEPLPIDPSAQHLEATPLNDELLSLDASDILVQPPHFNILCSSLSCEDVATGVGAVIEALSTAEVEKQEPGGAYALRPRRPSQKAGSGWYHKRIQPDGIQPFGSGCYVNHSPKATSTSDKNEVDDDDGDRWDDISLVVRRDLMRARRQRPGTTGTTRSFNSDDQADSASNMDTSNSETGTDDEPDDSVRFSAASCSSSLHVPMTVDGDESESSLYAVPKPNQSSPDVFPQPHTGEESSSFLPMSPMDATPLPSGLPSPPDTPGPSFIQDRYAPAETPALKLAPGQIQELKQALHLEQRLHQSVSNELEAARQRCLHLESDVCTLQTANNNLKASLAASTAEAQDLRRRANSAEAALRDANRLSEERIRGLEEQLRHQDTQICALEESRCCLIVERDSALADVETLNIILTEERTASRCLSTQLEKANEDAQDCSDRAMASENARELLARELEARTVALQRECEASDARADASLEKANAAEKEAAEHKANANSVAAKSREIEDRLRIDLKKEQDRRWQVQQAALRQVSDAKQRTSDALKAVEQVKDQLRNESDCRQRSEEDFARARQEHSEKIEKFDQEREEWKRKQAELVRKVQQQEDAIICQRERADEAARRLEQLELHIRNFQVTMNEGFSVMLAHPR